MKAIVGPVGPLPYKQKKRDKIALQLGSLLLDMLEEDPGNTVLEIEIHDIVTFVDDFPSY